MIDATSDNTLILMQAAREHLLKAFGKLLAADGLDEVLDDLTEIYIRLGDEIREYKQHTYGVTNDE